MQIIIDEIMKILEIIDIRYMYIAVALIIGGLLIWKK